METITGTFVVDPDVGLDPDDVRRALIRIPAGHKILRIGQLPRVGDRYWNGVEWIKFTTRNSDQYDMMMAVEEAEIIVRKVVTK